MPIFIFSIMVDPATEVEIKEVAAPDFLLAVHTLASWRRPALSGRWCARKRRGQARAGLRLHGTFAGLP